MSLLRPSAVAGLWLSGLLLTAACSDKSAHPPHGIEGSSKPQVVVVPSSPSAVQTTAAAAPPSPPTSQPKPEPVRKDVVVNKGNPANLRVKRLVIAKNVEHREPVDPATAFKKGDFGRLFAFVEVENPDKGASEVVVKFVPPSAKHAKGNVELAVGSSPRWRTWASTRSVDEVGTWTAVVSTKDGRELARQTFDVML